MTEHSNHPPFPQAEQRALRKDRFVYFSNTGPMEDMDRIKPLIQAFLANAERLINAAKDVHKPSPLPLPWQACNVACSHYLDPSSSTPYRFAADCIRFHAARRSASVTPFT